MEVDFLKNFVSQREYDKDQARLLVEMKGVREDVEKRLQSFDAKLDLLLRKTPGAVKT